MTEVSTLDPVAGPNGTAAPTSNGIPSTTSAKTSSTALVHVPVNGAEAVAPALGSHSPSLSSNTGLPNNHVGLANNQVGLANNIGLANGTAGLASVDSLLILSKFDELITEIRGLRDELKDFKGQQAAATAAAAEAAKDSGVRKVSRSFALEYPPLRPTLSWDKRVQWSGRDMGEERMMRTAALGPAALELTTGNPRRA